MIKGLTKTVVIMKCEKESIFEEAIFFLRDPEATDSDDIVTVASKLIGLADKEKSRNKVIKKKLIGVITFVSGVGAGIFCMLLVGSIS